MVEEEVSGRKSETVCPEGMTMATANSEAAILKRLIEPDLDDLSPETAR